jgi:hypothetical protein
MLLVCKCKIFYLDQGSATLGLSTSKVIEKYTKYEEKRKIWLTLQLANVLILISVCMILLLGYQSWNVHF